MTPSAKYITAAVTLTAAMTLGICVAYTFQTWKYSILIILGSVLLGFIGLVCGVIANIKLFDEG